MKVYNVPENTPVGQLINKIEETAKSKGLTLSRWQANHGKYGVTIHYAVHGGERAARFIDQEGIVADVELKAQEGHTDKCIAFHKLEVMLNNI